MDGDPPHLPEEIIRNILIRLPVKSLIRFQCVCKHWKNLFKTPSFIADHLRRSHQNSFLLYECYGACDPYDQCDRLHLCLVDREIRLREIQNAPRIHAMTVVKIVDSSNGLLCLRLHGTAFSLLVYNLAKREVILVPKALNHVGEEFYVGFGFSSIVNDYRIVRLCASLSDDLVYGGEVFSLSTGSWKKLEVGNLKGVTLIRVDGFTIDGCIFWFGSKLGLPEEGENDHPLIVSFDIAMEVFSLIPMPPRHLNFETNFTVYENKLAVLCPIGNSESCLIELWVMEEDTNAAGARERWSWTKKYSSNPYPCWLHPKTIWKNEIVCSVYPIRGLIRETEGEVENGEIKTLLINLLTNEFNTFAHRRLGPYHGIFNHVESLVPLNNVANEEP